MFKRKTERVNRNINIVKIGEVDLRNLGLYLEEDFELNYNIAEEIEQILVLGRKQPRIKHKYIPTELTIDFKLKEQSNFYERIEHIKSILKISNGKLLTFNKENTGHRILFSQISDIGRDSIENSISIYFVLDSNIESDEK